MAASLASLQRDLNTLRQQVGALRSRAPLRGPVGPRGPSGLANDGDVAAALARVQTEKRRVTDYSGVDKTGVAASDAGIASAIGDLPEGGEFFSPPGTYRVVQGVIVQTSGLRLTSAGATYAFPSADESLVGTAAYGNLSQNQRSALYINGADDVLIERLGFQGDSVENRVTVNTGAAVAISSGKRLHLRGVVQMYGGGLVHGLAAAEDSLVEHCYSYGSRNNSYLGNGGTFLLCVFELPPTPDFDRIGGTSDGTGSSHAIYQSSSRGQRLLVDGCRFIWIRTDCVKVSGTASALSEFQARNLRAENCGRNADGSLASGAVVLFGADTLTPTHGSCSISGLKAIDCGALVQVLGAKNVLIEGVQSFHTTTPVDGLGATIVIPSAISISQHTADTEPVEDAVVTDCILDADVPSGTVFCTSAITATRVGRGLPGRTSTLRIANTLVGNGYSKAFTISNCLNPVIEGVTASNTTTLGTLSGCRMPRVRNCQMLDQRSDNAALRLVNCAWPIIECGAGGGVLLGGHPGKMTVGDNANGSTPVRMPLAGVSGLVVPTNGQPEVVVPYGDPWTAGDIFNLNGTQYVYGSDFNDIASLIALIDGLADYECADYGDPWGITWRHLRVRWATPNATPNLFYIETVCADLTAGGPLRNSSLGSGNRCYSRGENVDSLVVWSPCIQQGQIPTLQAANADAATVLQAAVPYPLVTDEVNEAGACAVLVVAGMDAAGLSPEFRWSL